MIKENTPKYINDYTDVNLDQMRMMTNLNQDVFRYGLHSGNINSQYEDPTFLGFTIEIDEESALFTDARKFIENNRNHAEIRGRLKLYDNFTQLIKMLFNSQDSSGTDSSNQYVKQHYINSISGLRTLSKKFVKYKEDKLSFELYEDIALFSTYLSTTYNNLVYSYDSGRILIPENLMHFNLYIKISEIRNHTSLKYLASTNLDEVKLAREIKKNSTSMVYKLTDCLFNFFEAQPFDDRISQSGIDTAFPAQSIVNFDLYFKRINLIMNAPLVPGGVYFDNRDTTLALKDISVNTVSTPYNTEYTPQNTAPTPYDTSERDGINYDISSNALNNSAEAKREYDKNTNTLDRFINENNKRASGMGRLGNQGTLDLEDDYSNFEAYDDQLQKLKDYNTSVMDIDKLPKGTEISKLKENINNTGNIIFGDDDSGNNFEAAGKQSKKNLWLEAKGKIDSIKSANNEVTDFYAKKTVQMNQGITNKLGSQVGNVVGGMANTISNSALRALQKYENILNNKKNEMFNKFLYEIKSAGKILLDYNVYTDSKDPMLKEPLKELYDTMGNTVVDQLIGSLKDSTNTNITR